MNELELLQRVLEISIAKNGDKSLTLSHLKNLIGIAIKMKEHRSSRFERFESKLAAEFSDPNL